MNQGSGNMFSPSNFLLGSPMFQDQASFIQSPFSCTMRSSAGSNLNMMSRGGNNSVIHSNVGFTRVNGTSGGLPISEDSESFSSILNNLNPGNSRQNELIGKRQANSEATSHGETLQEAIIQFIQESPTKSRTFQEIFDHAKEVITFLRKADFSRYKVFSVNFCFLPDF